jgi:transcriptional regulator with XRE-family HTH domain
MSNKILLSKSIFSDEYENFLKILIEARKKLNLTQQGLAVYLNKPQSFVSKYERKERRLDVIEFVIISKILGLDPCTVIQTIEKNIYN